MCIHHLPCNFLGHLTQRATIKFGIKMCESFDKDCTKVMGVLDNKLTMYIYYNQLGIVYKVQCLKKEGNSLDIDLGFQKSQCLSKI